MDKMKQKKTMKVKKEKTSQIIRYALSKIEKLSWEMGGKKYSDRSELYDR
ncbi:MAG: hypothetical protein V1720_18205 [bacterium]